MTVPHTLPLKNQRDPARPDRTALLLTVAVVTSLLLLITEHPAWIGGLPAGVQSFAANPLTGSLILTLFLANLLFAYLWRAAGWAKALVFVGCVFWILPWAGRDNGAIFDTAINIGIYAALALGLNIVVGLAGLLDLGYIAFFAVGAYTWGIFGSGQIGRVLSYYGQNPGGTAAGYLTAGLLLAIVTAASFLALLRLKGKKTRAQGLLQSAAGLGLAVGIILSVRGLILMATPAAGGLAGGLNANFFWLFLALAVLAAAIVGVLIGLPVLRLKGDYLAIITLGLGEVIRVLANNLTTFTNGSQGTPPIQAPSVPLFDRLAGAVGFDPSQYVLFFLYFLVIALIVVIVTVNIRLDNSRIGRAWIAIREDEIAAQAMGVPLMKTKLIAFATGASFAGAMGVVFAAKQAATITPESFVLNESISVLTMVILGGMGNFVGVMLGAAVVVLLRFSVLPSLGEATSQVAAIPQQVNPAQLQRLVFGVILVVMMLFRPEGLLPARRQQLIMHEGDEDVGGDNEGPNDSLSQNALNDGTPSPLGAVDGARVENDRAGGAK